MSDSQSSDLRNSSPLLVALLERDPQVPNRKRSSPPKETPPSEMTKKDEKENGAKDEESEGSRGGALMTGAEEESSEAEVEISTPEGISNVPLQNEMAPSG